MTDPDLNAFLASKNVVPVKPSYLPSRSKLQIPWPNLKLAVHKPQCWRSFHKDLFAHYWISVVPMEWFVWNRTNFVGRKGNFRRICEPRHPWLSDYFPFPRLVCSKPDTHILIAHEEAPRPLFCVDQSRVTVMSNEQQCQGIRAWLVGHGCRRLCAFTLSSLSSLPSASVHFMSYLMYQMYVCVQNTSTIFNLQSIYSAHVHL